MEEQVKKPIWKRWWFWALIIIIAIAAFSGDAPENAPTEPVSSQQAKSTEKNVADMTLEEYVKYLANDTLGKTNTKKERFIEAVGGGDVLIIHMNADENLTEKMMRTGILMDSKDLFKRAFNERSDINTLKLVWYLDLVDAKGNTSVGQVMHITLSRENADTINWDNILTDNLPKVADGYWEHPLFSK